MILFVAISIYIPGLFLQPKYNFLYSIGGDYYPSQVYSVSNNHVTVNPQYAYYPNNVSNPQLYIHNAVTNESTPVTLDNAENLTLDSSAESPDGYTLESGNQNDGFFPFFWYSRDYSAEYLVGHNTSKKLNIKNNNTSYYDSIHFLGWIMQ